MPHRSWPVGAVTLLLATAAGPARAQTDSTRPPAPSAPTGYAEAQASRGEEVFRRVCAQCHVASQFTGDHFHRAWTGRPAYELFELIRTRMPEDNPGRLRRREYADVVAYLFKLNGAPPGAAELVPDPDSLRLVRFPTAPDPRP